MCTLRGFGQTIESKFPFAPDATGNMKGIQKDGSGRTYANRYALVGVLGLSMTDPDDDGKAASRPVEAAKEAAPKITEEQVATLRALAEEVGKTAGDICTRAKIDRVSEMPASWYGAASKWLEGLR